MNALYHSDLPDLTLLQRGKVRDLYALDAEHLLIVTTDRLSAFDVVLPQPIPGKGEVLARLSRFWFQHLAHHLPHHLSNHDLARWIPDPAQRAALGARAQIVRQLKPLPIEAIVRGYLIGSGWRDYQRSGMVCGLTLAPRLQQADRLPEPIFTPSTKAADGDHDLNISFDDTVALIGAEFAEQVREMSLLLYREAADYAQSRGIIIADTKFEFGLDSYGRLHWIDEALTPDSSRFWPAEHYRPGISPPSFDKQYVRNYLESLDWDKTPPAPTLPADVIAHTAAKYAEAERRLTA